jgi:hypothetical protein
LHRVDTTTTIAVCCSTQQPRPQVRIVAMMHHHFHTASSCRRRLNALCCVFLLLVVFGCGTGEYERRLSERASRPKPVASFNELYAPLALPNLPAVSVRMPVVMFKDTPLVEGSLVGGKPVDSRRVKPLLFELPWLKLTYEGFVDGADGKTPYYCYVAAIDNTAGKVQNPEAGLRTELSGKQPQTLSDWTDVQTPTPEGQAIAWRQLRFVGPQEFCIIDKAGQGQFKTLPGVLEIYLRPEAGYYVLIAWRTPSAIEQQVDLAKWASPVAGCVSVKK